MATSKTPPEAYAFHADEVLATRSEGHFSLCNPRGDVCPNPPSSLAHNAGRHRAPPLSTGVSRSTGQSFGRSIGRSAVGRRRVGRRSVHRSVHPSDRSRLVGRLGRSRCALVACRLLLCISFALGICRAPSISATSSEAGPGRRAHPCVLRWMVRCAAGPRARAPCASLPFGPAPCR